MKTGIIYGLYHPITGEIRYIGKTIRPDKRLNEHIQKANKGPKYPVYNWIRKLFKEGLKPELEIIETSNEDQLAELEVFYITKAKEFGWRLLNSTDGGEGNSGHIYTEEQRQKFRDAWVKRKLVPISDETRKKYSLVHKGKPKTVEQRIKMSEAAKGAKNHNFGKRPSQESIDKARLKTCKPVICLTTGQTFISCREAGKILHIDSSGISKVCRSILPAVRGYIFRYL